jgi:para-nitrobenzyl esterase
LKFAETGDPNGAGLPSWPTYDAATRRVLEIGDTLQTRVVLDEAVVDFYDQGLGAR